MAKESSDTRPNVLLVCFDHLGGHMMRPAGHPAVMTPTLAQLAGSGVMYTNAYSCTPTCVPARRSLMTGLTAQSHGDRTFKSELTMPDAPTMAQCFRDAGYQAYAVGKLHVYPQRNRIGFDDVLLNEEGRHQFEMTADDWEQYLADRGFGGQAFAGGMNNNDYMTRPWHLPEDCHPANWTASQMCRVMHRRDPTRPAFWYLSFTGPHPPLWPPQAYMDMYRDVPIDEPVVGDWARDPAAMPLTLRKNRYYSIVDAPPHEVELARRAFYATITHLDHQLRVVLGYLREQGLLQNTVVAVTSDHGDMLGDHGLWAKGNMLDNSARVPMILAPRPGDERFKPGTRDDRLARLEDIMPTLLELAGIETPSTVEGRSLLTGDRRELLFAEHYEGEGSTRMIRDDRYKLIYYAAGNVTQLFDMHEDPRECRDLSGDPDHAKVKQRLTAALIEHLWGEDRAWVKDGRLVGVPDPGTMPSASRDLTGQRGLRYL